MSTRLMTVERMTRNDEAGADKVGHCRLQYISRQTATITCQMTLKDYPLDVQVRHELLMVSNT